MKTLRDHHSAALFDPWDHLGPRRRKLLEKSWAGLFREFLLSHLPVHDLAAAFSDGQGRPSKDLFMALGALILQQLHDLTDQETVESLALNITWHYALDIRHESDAYLCERTLRNYRAKVIEAGLEQSIFRSLTDTLIEQFGVNTAKQRLDSTAIRSAIRGLTRLGILVEATNKFLRELKRKEPDLFSTVDAELIRKYLERRGEGCFANTRPSESKRRLPEAAHDIFALVQQFQASAAGKLEGFRLLHRIFDEQCEVTDHDDKQSVLVKPPQKMDCTNVVNPADPDARYNKHRGTGYLVQIMETFEEDDTPSDPVAAAEVAKPDLITHVAVTEMTRHDKDALQPALEETAQRDVKPTTLLADSHYGSMECLETGRQHNVTIVAPDQTPKGKLQGKLTLEDFELDEAGRITLCPGGATPVKTSVADQKLEALFDGEQCTACPLLNRCPAAAVGRHAARFQYTPERVKHRARRLAEQSDEFREQYRWRAGVEATMSRFKHCLGMAKLRVRGKPSVTFTASMRALGLNIRRATAYRAATT